MQQAAAGLIEEGVGSVQEAKEHIDLEKRTPKRLQPCNGDVRNGCCLLAEM